MKKKVIIVVSLVIVALILFVPIPMRLKDGGSVKYSALLYSVTDVHRMSSAMEGYEEGTIIEVLGLEVYNNVISGIEKNDVSVVLLHDSEYKETTLEATPKILEKLIEMNALILPITSSTVPVHHNI